jgi:hypothetical protein
LFGGLCVPAPPGRGTRRPFGSRTVATTPLTSPSAAGGTDHPASAPGYDAAAG